MSDKNELIAEALFDIAKSLRLLGNGNIARDDLSPGAIEGLAMTLRDTGKELASSLDGIANAITELAEASRHPGENTP
jgi:hypothetical protein